MPRRISASTGGRARHWLGAVSSALALAGCGTSDGPMSSPGQTGPDVHADGGLASAPVSAIIDGVNYGSETANAFFVKSRGVTDLVASLRGGSPAAQNRLVISFAGASVGQFQCGGSSPLDATYETAAGSYSTTSTASVTPCRLDVTSYGSVGGSIVGTFSAVLVGTSLTGTAPKQVQITNGTFDVVRGADTP